MNSRHARKRHGEETQGNLSSRIEHAYSGDRESVKPALRSTVLTECKGKNHQTYNEGNKPKAVSDPEDAGMLERQYKRQHIVYSKDNYNGYDRADLILIEAHGHSPFLKPHSGQNFDLMSFVPQFGQIQPLFSSGFFAPHSGQNLLVISFVPHSGQVQPCLSSGFFAPHSGQNLLVIFSVPHLEHVQPPAGLGSGFLAPQSGQNLKLIPALPQEGHVQPSAAG